MFVVWKALYGWESKPSQFDLWIQCNSNQILPIIWHSKLILKFIWKGKDKKELNILLKNKIENIYICHFKSYYKATQMKSMLVLV